MRGSWIPGKQYRDVTRLGRRSRLTQAQRAALWQVFEVIGAAALARRDHAAGDSSAPSRRTIGIEWRIPLRFCGRR